jgi:hypothetical protein
MTAFAPTKVKDQLIENIRPEFREELPKRGLLFLVGNLHSTGRRVVVDLDRASMHVRQRVSFPQGTSEGPKGGGRQKLSAPQMEELILRANALWASDPRFREARRSVPDDGVTLLLVDGGRVKQFDSHDPADEIHAMYKTVWQWADTP